MEHQGNNKDTEMTLEQVKWVLSLDEQFKLDTLADMLEQDEFAMALQFSKMLLDAPISQGGIASEKITEIFNRYGRQID